MLYLLTFLKDSSDLIMHLDMQGLLTSFDRKRELRVHMHGDTDTKYLYINHSTYLYS